MAQKRLTRSILRKKAQIAIAYEQEDEHADTNLTRPSKLISKPNQLLQYSKTKLPKLLPYASKEAESSSSNPIEEESVNKNEDTSVLEFTDSIINMAGTSNVQNPCEANNDSNDCIQTSSKSSNTKAIEGDISTGEGSSAKKPKWSPPNWEILYESIKKMRSQQNAPVDTMGCERTMEKNVEPKVRRYQTLVSLMLSSQTKDEVTFGAMERLKSHGLTVENILSTSEDELGKLIYPVGFWRRKAKYIKRTTEILHEKLNGDIPDSIEGLIKLPGVGQKMGYIALAVAFGKNDGIGVDTHVHRICNRLKWTNPKGETKTPDKTREAIEAWLPQHLWPQFNVMLVGFGQTICTPVNPKCNICDASAFCPYFKKGKKKLSE